MFGKDHPDTLTCMDNLAMVLQAQEKYDAAEEMSQRVLDGREKVLGKGHPNTLTSMHRLAFTYYTQGRHVEAIQPLQDVIVRQTETIGPDHPSTKDSSTIMNYWLRIQNTQPAPPTVPRPSPEPSDRPTKRLRRSNQSRAQQSDCSPEP